MSSLKNAVCAYAKHCGIVCSLAVHTSYSNVRGLHSNSHIEETAVGV
jgi:hypothetical protein